ncbi:MAG: right-handed parallel beta-helix repeat-containing protein, partial [Cyanobacteria bacterium J06659_2]
GVWIEAGSPVLLENVFAGSGHAGIFIAGQGEPMIARNHFYQNAVAGLVIYGASTATVQENLFEQTGVGITVSESAMPRIINNRIVQNREGIVLLSGADPVLEGNDIRHNRRNGVVDFGDAPAIAAVIRPTPSANTAATTPAGAAATETVPGPPVSPADSSVATQQAPAPSGQTAPPIPEAPSTAIAEPPASTSSSTAVAAGPTEPPAAAPAPDRAETTADPVTEIAASPPNVPEQPASIAATSAASLPDLPAPTAAAPSVEPLPPVTEPSVTETSGVDAVPLAIGPTPDPAAAEPIPSGDSAALPATEPPTVAANNTAATPAPNADPGPDVDALFARLNLRRPGDLSRPLTDTPDNREQTASPTPPNAQPDAVEIAVIPPTVEAAPEQSPSTVENDLPNDLPAVPDDGASLPQLDGDVLRVPNSNVPVGSPGGMANVIVPATLASAGGAPPSPPSRAAALGLYYRVLVEAPDETTQNQVRSLVSDAFRTRFQGRVMMQTGAYEEESVAIEMVEMLQHYGLDAQIEDIRQN